MQAEKDQGKSISYCILHSLFSRWSPEADHRQPRLFPEYQLTGTEQCDQKPDGCSQCAKVQKECPGYRVQLDLMFRNESTAVVKKAKAKEALKKSKALAATTAPAATTTLVTIPKKTEQVDQSFLVKAKQRDWTFPRYNKGPPANAALPSPSAGPSIMPSLVDAASGFFIQNFVIGLANPNSGAGDRNALVRPLTLVTSKAR